GGIDDYRAETVDIMPTIAAILQVDLPWSTDGTSLFGGNRPEREESRIEGSEGIIVFGSDGSEARDVAARKIEHFGADGPLGLAPPGYADLLGRSVAELGMISDSDMTATVRNPNAFTAVDPTGPSIPAWISGTIETRGSHGEGLILAIVVNGRIAAITRTSDTEDGSTQYAALIPPNSFVDGRNDVDLYLIRGSGNESELLRVGR
ncbi:MAG: hypothetical protein U9R51_04070, partial [Actinomycetota bacterium]|nr:hypothetical protein [Actinomycetota bacterium]